MEQYQITGMSCAACQARVEKAVQKVDGVTSCSVSLLTNSMGVEGTASKEAIIAAVEAAGYGASSKATAQQKTGKDYSAEEEALQDHESPVLKKRLLFSLGFLVVLMYVSMGHMMFGFPLPEPLADNHVAMGLLELLLAGIVMVINQKFFVNGFGSLFHGAPNMDTLVAMGSMASFGWSTYVLFCMTAAVQRGDTAAVMAYMDDFYFESAAMIVTLITVGKMLEAMSKGRTTDALKSLMRLAPKTATKVENGQERLVSIEEIQVGDLFMVRPGESIPVDGVIVKGQSAINEAALTGESIPVDKTINDKVSAATINQEGAILCRATRVGEDTTLAQIIRMVSDASATKAPIAKIADRVSGVFVPAVIGIAIVTAFIWILVSGDLGYSLARGIAVLVISCPCALGLATPVAIMVGNGVGAKQGIMFKTAVSLEETGKADIVVLDKTGTITKGEPEVTDVLPSDGISEEQLLYYAVTLEEKSEHPLSKAVMEYGMAHAVEKGVAKDFAARPGKGLQAYVDDAMIVGGNRSFVQEVVEIPAEVQKQAENLAEAGKTPLFFAKDNQLLGMIAVADTVKEDSKIAIGELKNMGIRTVMLTGDNARTAHAIGNQVGVDAVVAGVLPDGKEATVAALQTLGKVVMVGDGLNDAPALSRADMGIAIGAGTDVAIDAADVVVVKSRLTDVSGAIRLSRATLRNIHENLFWAFFYNVIGIPLAAGAYIHLFHWALNPMFGAAAMSLSSFCVVSNALRLNLVKVHDGKKDKKKKKEVTISEIKQVLETNQEEKNMNKTLKIEGMMCGHCEATVKKALEALDGVSAAEVSHEKGTAVVTLSGEVADEVLRQAVEEKDYKVVGLE